MRGLINVYLGLATTLGLLGAAPAFALDVERDTSSPRSCRRIVSADIVAIEQAYLLNRFSAFVPAGMMFALKRDVVSADDGSGAPPSGELRPGEVALRPDKRPRPIVLRANEGDCLEVRLTNLLSPLAEEEGGIPRDYGGRMPAFVGARAGSPLANELAPAQKVSVDAPRTRAASFHITGLELSPIPPEDCPVDAACGGDGSNVGLPTQSGLVFNPATSVETRARFDIGSLAHPGQTVVTRWRARTEGAYFAYSTAAPVGGEGDGGQIGLGLFGSVNVEPGGSRWYRSQVTHEEMLSVAGAPAPGRHRYSNVDYDREIAGVPVLALLNAANEIVHTDLNAIVVPPALVPAGVSESSGCAGGAFGALCGKPFREFTAIFHDEVHAEQAFAELDDESDPLHLLKDGMGINYGVSSMGSLMLATQQFGKNIGPAKKCPECRAEEFFLSSWANGDPALILSYDDDGKPNGARYPDDPSNVHHSYLGDSVRFRNLHAGPKETHVFHLHAHQWVQDSTDPNSTYLDSQTISPGATFSYAIEFGGSGNRNYTPGDSIFHCHLYPHFAQGMWELWRSHDAFTDGKKGYFDAERPVGPTNDPEGMNLPDAEIASGTETPALVPLPGAALAPMPTREFRGYPFYIPGEKGHRPPQPALDLDVAGGWTDLSVEPDPAKLIDGGLPRHIVVKGDLEQKPVDDALATGGKAAQVIAQRVQKQDPAALAALAKEWKTVELRLLDESGEADEKRAMAFHEGELTATGLQKVSVPQPPHPEYWNPTKAYRTDVSKRLPSQPAPSTEPLFYVNARPRAQGAPYANPCPDNAPQRDYRAAFIQTELTYNKHGWFDPQGRIIVLENDIKDVIDPNKRSKLPEPLFFRANSGECINFKSSNFVPPALNVDDFQIYTPTDTIGQHIHLVKFDVTSSDGSGNGFNYEDATFSPLEVQERIFAYNRTPHENGSPKTEAEKLTPKAHPLFLPGGDIYEAAQADPVRYEHLLSRGQCPAKTAEQSEEQYEHDLRTEHDLCAAQRTTQRWWADPILNKVSGKDNTLRTVFTHDHMGPSSHQQHGLYAGLVIEPANSVWTPIGIEPGGRPETPAAEKLTVADMAALGDGAQLKCGSVAPNDPQKLCPKVIGGSALALKTDPALLKGADPIEGVIEPRPPLKLREDGGPTASKANIIAPDCIGDSDSNVLQPDLGRNRAAGSAMPPCRRANDTRREFELALADFGIAYNTALEPINPEPMGDSMLRDKSSIRFGRRHVATTPARPLAISSEDPGSQYFNYRHEPIALRISQATPNLTIGGWDYRQNQMRADLTTLCQPQNQDCLGDPANAFSSSVNAKRDAALAFSPLVAVLNPATRALLAGTGAAGKLDDVLADVEQWRVNFNCALYPESLVPKGGRCPDKLERPEPARVFGDPATPLLTAYEGDPVQIRMVQGAQEAQHVFTMNGVKWRRLPGDEGDPAGEGSGYVNAQPIGISEHFEFNVSFARLDASHVDHLYFGSSMDQLWDGLWGTMRSFSKPRLPGQSTTSLKTSAATDVSFSPESFLKPLDSRPAPDRATFTGGPNGKESVCAPGTGDDGQLTGRYFDVAVARACDLVGQCDGPKPGGIEYSSRFRIYDENAIVYVLEDEGSCDAQGCEAHSGAWSRKTNSEALKKLRAQFDLGRRLEPLALRAAAGQCLSVNLRNTLKPQGVVAADAAKVDERQAFYNFLPMIADGFNINQFRMSSTVGLSPARLTINPIWGDGSNVGLNGAVALGGVGGFPDEPPAGDQLRRQGSLLPPCVGDPAVDGTEEDRCKATYSWSTMEFDPGGADDGTPVEFAAVPLRSFGDPIKHPAHGLVGALSVGPKGSAPCTFDRFAQTIGAPDDADRLVIHGLSSEICKTDGSRYTDHILVMQDGVSATRGGMPVPNLAGAEEPDDYGVKAINYKTEPLWARSVNEPSVGFPERNAQDLSSILSSATITDGQTNVRCRAGMPPNLSQIYPCDPETPVLEARPGETLRISFVHPGGHTRQTGLAISGHSWTPYPWTADSRTFDPGRRPSIREGVFNGFGPMMGVTFQMQAGGRAKVPLDYLIRSQAAFQFDGGQWAILRVREKPAGAAKASN